MGTLMIPLMFIKGMCSRLIFETLHELCTYQSKNAPIKIAFQEGEASLNTDVYPLRYIYMTVLKHGEIPKRGLCC